MDFFKKGQAMLNKNNAGSSSHTTGTTGATTTGGTQPAGQQMDYGDKGMSKPGRFLFSERSSLAHG